MNHELLSLLRVAGVEGAVSWHDVIVLYNYAPVPAPPVHGDFIRWNRGFNLVILRGTIPTYYVKCRPRMDEVLEWETTVRSCVAGDRPNGVSVAPVRAASSDGMTIQVSPFLRGTHYGHIAPVQSDDEYLRTLRTVLGGTRELADLALQGCPRLREGTVQTIALAEAAAADLALVVQLAQLDAQQEKALVAALSEAGTAPARPQHGDFWWQNLIQVDGHLWAIDFDSYGTVRVPLFDDMTLLITTLGLRGGGTEGLERLISPSPDAVGCRSLLLERAKSEGLKAFQLNGILVYYLTTMAASVHRRGGFGFSTPHVAAVRRAAERLASGERLLPMS